MLVDPSFPVNWAAPLNSGLVAWYLALPSQRIGTVVHRDLVLDGHMTMTNMAPATQWNPTFARPGGWSSFNVGSTGTDDYLTTPDKARWRFTSGNFFLSAWIKTTDGAGIVIGRLENSGSFTGWEWCISQGNVAVNPGKPSVYNGAAWHSATTAVNDGNWHWIAYDFNGGTGTFYLDGKADGSAGSRASPNGGASGKPLQIGTRDSATLSTSLSLDAALDDIRLHARSFADTEIAALYRASRAGYRRELNWLTTPLYAPEQVAASFDPADGFPWPENHHRYREPLEVVAY